MRIERSLSEKAQRALRQRLQAKPFLKVIALRVEGRVWPTILI